MIGTRALLILVMAVAGAQGAVRLAPTTPERWHVRPATLVAAAPPWPTGGVQVMQGGAYAARLLPALSPAEALARLDAVARATPRTIRLAGDPDSGLITWQTRSLLWGFPDFTTAEAVVDPAGGTRLAIVARQRFGREDMGVNAARLTDWLARL